MKTSITNLLRRSRDACGRFFARQRIIRRLLRGCDHETFAAMRCPVCDGDIALTMHEKVQIVDITCADDPTHLHHQTACPADYPAWWQRHAVDDGWFDAMMRRDGWRREPPQANGSAS